MKMPREAATKVKPEGIYAAAITPRREGEVEVDLGSMLDAIDFLTSRGVNGIALFGATGEFTHFTIEERSRFIGLATKRCRVPVLANVSHSTLDGAIALAEEAAGSGVAGVLIMPPYFFRYDSETIRAYFLEFADQVAKWTQVYLYNVPMFTNAIPLELAELLLRSGNFAGIKDSSGDWRYLEHLLRLRAETKVSILCGHDRLFAQARLSGADAGISGVAAALPELMVGLSRALADGDQAAAARLQLRLEEYLYWIDRFPVPVAIREAAALRGLKTGPSAAPLGGAGKASLEEFRGWFKEWVQEVANDSKSVA
jgi:dihydrodipicolinate synthase/N-acetylneuraminate lyase